MDSKCYFWVLNHLDKYSFSKDAVRIKEGILGLLQSEESLDHPKALQKLDGYYQQLTENFYNNFVGYRNGIACKNIVSSELDCYFINTADGMIPIGYYKEIRPVEATMLIQKYLKNCEENIPLEQEGLRGQWEKDLEEISEYYQEKRNKKHSSPAKCILSIVVSVIYLLMTTVAFFLSRGFQVIFSGMDAELLQKIQKSMPCLARCQASTVSSFITFLIFSSLIVFAFLLFSAWELKLALDKKVTDQLLDEFDHSAENIESYVKEDITHKMEEVYIATRQGKNFKTMKSKGAIAINQLNKKIKTAKTYSIRMYIHSHVALVIILAICTCIMPICFTKAIPTMQDKSAYTEANTLLNNGSYEEAYNKFESIKHYKDSKERLLACRYEQAKSMLEQGSYSEARDIFRELDDYEDSAEFVNECDYRKALAAKEEGDYVAAYNRLISLGDYRDSKKQAKNLIEEVYNKGIALYRGKEYSEAEKCFEISKKFGREKDYLTLIKASKSRVGDLSALYALIDFEDTKEVLLNNYNIYNFLKGEWRDTSGRYIRYYDTQTGTRSEYNLNASSGNYYKLEDGCHMIGSGSSYSKQWRYTIIDVNTIEVFSYRDYETYRMYRR